MKQVVTELWNKNSVQINLSYEFDEELIGYKEWQELVKVNGNKKIVKYWVQVACNAPQLTKKIKPDYQSIYRERKRKEKEKIAEDRRIRIENYRIQIENGQEEITFY